MAEQPTSQKPLFSLAFEMKPATREFKIPQRRWSQKRRLKREFAFFQFPSQLLQLSFFVKCKQTLFDTNSLELYSSSQRETKFCRRLFTSSIKREIKHFQVVVEQWLRRNGRKVWCTCRIVVLPIQLIAFLSFLLPSLSWHPIVFTKYS